MEKSGHRKSEKPDSGTPPIVKERKRGPRHCRENMPKLCKLKKKTSAGRSTQRLNEPYQRRGQTQEP